MIKKWILIILILGVVGLVTIQTVNKKTKSKKKTSVANVEQKIYWTCPMHPQIHSDTPGECPICHMKLVKVKEPAPEQNVKAGEKRSAVQAVTSQLELIGIQKQEVEKMALVSTIPVSGRVLSPTSMAFQAYESDVRYLRPGLTFKGASSIYPEEEFSGKIISVDSIVDPSSRTIRVIGSITQGAPHLIPETSFRGEVEIKLTNRIAISESSVLHTGQGDLVYVVTELNKLEPRYIKVGLKTNSFYEVLSGLNVGEFISSGPNFLIDSEAKIRGAHD
ncbi:MAG: heavy metal-binding domain-containing protein [Pseudomonadota bacterium]|nr:heavy metal-binding domain-containing protein [Pseudomonadota bacterium]